MKISPRFLHANQFGKPRSFQCMGKLLAQIELERWIAQWYLRNGWSKIDEQKSIPTGPIYIYTKWFESLLPEDVAIFEPHRVSNLITLVPLLCKAPNYIFIYRNDVVWCIENRKLIALTIQKI